MQLNFIDMKKVFTMMKSIVIKYKLLGRIENYIRKKDIIKVLGNSNKNKNYHNLDIS